MNSFRTYSKLQAQKQCLQMISKDLMAFKFKRKSKRTPGERTSSPHLLDSMIYDLTNGGCLGFPPVLYDKGGIGDTEYPEHAFRQEPDGACRMLDRYRCCLPCTYAAACQKQRLLTSRQPFSQTHAARDNTRWQERRKAPEQKMRHMTFRPYRTRR